MFTAHMPGVQHRVEEREVKARMDTPAVRAVLDMGFDRNVVLNAIRKQLSNRGKQNCKITASSFLGQCVKAYLNVIAMRSEVKVTKSQMRKSLSDLLIVRQE